MRAVGLSPEGFPADWSELSAFFEEAGAMPHGGVLWNGAWREDVAGGGDSGEAPSGAVLTVTQGAADGGTPVLVFGWRSGDSLHVSVPSDPTNDWTNQDASDAFVAMLARFAADHQPPFVFLGNESDAYYAQDPEGYAAWVRVYERAYDAVKAESPGTMVGPVFQFEHLAGIGVNTGWDSPHWGAVDAHAASAAGPDSGSLTKVDVLGLTVYPFFAHDRPGDVPDDYLAPLLSRIGETPVFITETGWPAEPSTGLPASWEASEAAQVAYVARLESFTSGVSLLGATWLFLYAPVPSGELGGTEFALFGSVSLREADGSLRPVLDAWMQAEFAGTWP